PFPSEFGVNGACETPRKPGVPLSAHGMCPIFGDRPTNAGTDGSTGPYTLDSTAPMLGKPPCGWRSPFVQPVRHWYARWPPSQPTTERMGTNFSIIAAIRGN